MKGFLIFPVLLILLFGTPTVADIGDGVIAYLIGDYATAFKEWQPLAEKGDVEAQTYLGRLYLDGTGVAQDYKAAFKWYTLSAKQGFDDAQFQLGMMYYLGQGVTQDYIRAHMWFNIAASQGAKDAAKLRGKVEEIMALTHVSEAQQLARECVAKNYKGC